MRFDHTNQDHIKKAHEFATQQIDDFYNSTEYQKEWSRYETRYAAYHCRHRSDMPYWRSKLHLATFWLGHKALEAQEEQAFSSWPFIYVKATDDSQIDPGAREKAEIANADLRYDLEVSRWQPKWSKMLWYVNLKGTAVAREYFRSSVETSVLRDAQGGNQENVRRVEKTITMPIHPLNYAHDIHCSDFSESPWASVRFEVPISEIYKMVGNKQYNQDGVRALIKKIEDGDGSDHGFQKSKTTFYHEHDKTVMARYFIVLDEFNGPVHTKMNMGNDQRYYMLMCKSYNITLRIGPTPFKGHPYWKVQPHPDPGGPFGVGPNDMLLPINDWENDTVNQYRDYMAASLKFMYKVVPDNIVGGAMALLDGNPLGLVEIESDENGGAWENSIEPLRTNQGTIAPVADMMSLIEKYKEKQGSSSNLRGHGSEQLNDTATGIAMMARREDTMTAALLAKLDVGIKDGMHIKLEFLTNFFEEGRVATFQRNGRRCRDRQHHRQPRQGRV